MDKNKHECHHERGSGNGFLLGVLVGVVLTLLFTTDKGRKILKELSENGLEALDDRLRNFEEGDENVVADEEDHEKMEVRPQTEVVRSPNRRFFRGIRRKS